MPLQEKRFLTSHAQELSQVVDGKYSNNDPSGSSECHSEWRKAESLNLANESIIFLLPRCAR
jgi:hypothetical protein